MRRPDEQPAVTPCRRFPVECDETIVQHVTRFFERDRPDLRHRAQVRQRFQHPLGTPQPASRECAEALDPVAPGALLGPLGQRIDDRQRELPQVLEVPAIAFESRDARGIGFVPLQLRDAVTEVGVEAVQPAPPPILPATNHRGFDDQLFPLPGRSQRAGDDRFLIRIDARVAAGLSVGPRIRGQVRRGIDVGVDLVGRQRRAFAARRLGRAHLGHRRYLSERQVLVEALRGESLDGAREQRDKRPAGGIRTPRAAIEIHGDAAARARVLEQPEILLRRAEEHGHLVERHAGGGFVKHTPDDLHRLASLAGRRKQDDVARALALSGTLGLEHITPQAGQVGRREEVRSLNSQV